MSWRNEHENWRTDCASDGRREERRPGDSDRNNAVCDSDRNNAVCDSDRLRSVHRRFNRGSSSRGSYQDGGLNPSGGYRGSHQNMTVNRNNGSDGSSQARGGRGRWRGGRPPGLKGKDIGLYYRDLQKKKPPEPPQTVSLDATKVRQISAMLGMATPPHSMHAKSQAGHVKPSDQKNSFTASSSIVPSSSIDPPFPQGGHVKQSDPRNSFTASSNIVPSCPRENEDDLNMDISTPDEVKLEDSWKYLGQEKYVDTQSLDWWTEVMNEDGMTVAASCSGPSYVKRRVTAEDQCTSTKLFDPHKTKAQQGVQQTAADKYSHVQESVFKRKFLQNLTGSMESNLAKSIARGNMELARDECLDDKLKALLLSKQQSSEHYKRMLQFRSKLPAHEMRHQILDLIDRNQVVLISGETGCGKTTQVAQFILDDFILKGKGSLCHVVCTQPRRISATSVAQRVADERDEVLGAESTGYQIRLEKKLPPRKQGTIVFCTTGVMLQWMLGDAGLTSISHLVLDEIHERDVTSDFVITLLKDVIPKRPDLKVILMSATLNAERFSAYYSNCPAINIPGFTFPVQVYYLEDVLQCTNFEFPPPRRVNKGWQKYLKDSKDDRDPDFSGFVLPYVRDLESRNAYNRRTLESLRDPASEEINIELIATLLHHICTSQREGAILVFLPGWREISKLHTELKEAAHFSSSRYLIIPLHSMMPTTVQRSVFDRPRSGVRKIILATNIAETSITIDDVVFVIDCGKIKMTNFDVERNISTLKPEWVSLANSKQRRGRAGRVQEGVCYHLYSRGREHALASYPLPEMLRTRLEQVVLQIKILQIGRVEPFLKRVMDPPDDRAVGLSLKMLRTLNALDTDENLTPLGYHLAKLPMDPQAGKMILMAAMFSCVDPILSVAAGLNFKDPFLLPLGKEAQVLEKKLQLAAGTRSDHLLLANAVSQWEKLRGRGGRDQQFCRDHFLSSGTLQLLADMKGQLAGYLQEMRFLASGDPKATEANLNSENVNLLRAIVCAGLYPNVAHIKMKQRRRKDPLVLVRTPEDGKVSIHIRSVNEKATSFESPFLVYHTKLRSSGVYLHDTTMVLPLALLFFGEGVEVAERDGHDTIHVDRHTYFRCKEDTANVVKVLRTKLDSILEHKISHPGTIDWDNASEGGILREIIDLFADEDFCR